MALKWTNQGHQFDEIGEVFRQNNSLVIIGENESISNAYKKIFWLKTNITLLCPDFDLKTLSDEELARFWIKNSLQRRKTVIIDYGNKLLTEEVIDRFIKTGIWERNVNLFAGNEFYGYLNDDYLMIFTVYATGQVYIKHNSSIVTLVCNYNCRDCLNYTPYIKNSTHFELNQLKHNMDIYFKYVDRVGFYQLSGGEPLLYPHISDLISYIAANYRNRIYELNIVTNCAKVPSDEFCLLLNKYDISVIIDDYSKQIPEQKERKDKCLEQMKKFNIRVISSEPVASFFRSFPPIAIETDINKLQYKYERCHPGWQCVSNYNNSVAIASCSYCAFAANAEIISDDPDNWYDLSSIDESLNGKKSLIEWRLGYNRKGYTEFCKICNGFPCINPLSAPAAIQSSGHIEWNIENPDLLSFS